jgi:hypothetical protein
MQAIRKQDTQPVSDMTYTGACRKVTSSDGDSIAVHMVCLSCSMHTSKATCAKTQCTRVEGGCGVCVCVWVGGWVGVWVGV